MPYKKDSHTEKQHKYYYNTYCSFCNTLLEEHDVVIMPCGHKVHMNCLKEDILKDLYAGFWDNWGVHDYYGHCEKKLRHKCHCHDGKSDCYLCIHSKEHKLNNVEEIKTLNEQCVGKILSGFYYCGYEIDGEGNIQFVCD